MREHSAMPASQRQFRWPLSRKGQSTIARRFNAGFNRANHQASQVTAELDKARPLLQSDLIFRFHYRRIATSRLFSGIRCGMRLGTNRISPMGDLTRDATKRHN